MFGSQTPANMIHMAKISHWVISVIIIPWTKDPRSRMAVLARPTHTSSRSEASGFR